MGGIEHTKARADGDGSDGRKRKRRVTRFCDAALGGVDGARVVRFAFRCDVHNFGLGVLRRIRFGECGRHPNAKAQRQNEYAPEELPDHMIPHSIRFRVTR